MARSKRSQQRRSSKPRQLIHGAQERCHEWLRVCLNFHQGIAKVNKETAKRGFHNAVMEYWVILYEYRAESQARSRWEADIREGGEPLSVGDTEIKTLNDCAKILYATQEKQSVEIDPIEGSKRSTEHSATYLSPEQATEIFQALNDIAHNLGFKAEPPQKERQYADFSQ